MKSCKNIIINKIHFIIFRLIEKTKTYCYTLNVRFNAKNILRFIINTIELLLFYNTRTTWDLPINTSFFSITRSIAVWNFKTFIYFSTKVRLMDVQSVTTQKSGGFRFYTGVAVASNRNFNGCENKKYHYKRKYCK